MMLNPRYGRIGMVSFPYWVFFEWLSPIIEVIGLIYFLIILILGQLDVNTFLTLTLFILSFAFAFSLLGIMFETIMFNKYKGYKYLLRVIIISMFELILFHPINVFYSLKGDYDFFIKNNTAWGVMKRTAFDSKDL